MCGTCFARDFLLLHTASNYTISSMFENQKHSFNCHHSYHNHLTQYRGLSSVQVHPMAYGYAYIQSTWITTSPPLSLRHIQPRTNQLLTCQSKFHLNYGVSYEWIAVPPVNHTEILDIVHFQSLVSLCFRRAGHPWYKIIHPFRFIHSLLLRL